MYSKDKSVSLHARKTKLNEEYSLHEPQSDCSVPEQTSGTTDKGRFNPVH